MLILKINLFFVDGNTLNDEAHNGILLNVIFMK